MQKASSILSSIGFVLTIVMLPLWAILAFVFGLLGNSNSILGVGEPLALGYVLAIVCGTFAFLTLISLIVSAVSRAKILNGVAKRNGYIGLIVGGALSINAVLVVAGILGLSAKDSQSN